MHRPAFVTLEGIDGSGKSTLAQTLYAELQAQGRPAVLTREPGGSPGAEEIRRLLVEGDPARWSPETEILLFYAARRDHLEKTILPALDAGKIVICDRFADSTRVYQGVARADLRPLVDRLHSLIIGREPDLTLVVDTDPAIALERGLARRSGEDRFEGFGLPFQQALRAGFLQLAEEYADRCHIIDGNRSPSEVGREAIAILRDALE